MKIQLNKFYFNDIVIGDKIVQLNTNIVYTVTEKRENKGGFDFLETISYHNGEQFELGFSTGCAVSEGYVLVKAIRNE